jgi:tetratricopeptide (TPR) repeat protein
LAFTLNDLASPYWQTGQLSRALEVRQEARELWRDLGNLPMLVDNLSRTVMVHLLAGEYDRAIAVADEAYAVSESIDQVWGQANSRLWIGYVYLERGEPGKAIEVMEEAVRLGQQVQFVPALIFTQADLGWVYGMLGAPQRGIELVAAAAATARQDYRSFLPWPMALLARLHVRGGDLEAAADAVQVCYGDVDLADMLYLTPVWVSLADAELALARDDPARAIEVIDRLLAHMRNHHWQAFVSDALHAKGQALLAEGRPEAAHTVLEEARDAAEALGSRRSLWRILAALGQIAAAEGNTHEAARLRDEAAQIVKSIADHLDIPELRASFLAQPHVQQVVAD